MITNRTRVAVLTVALLGIMAMFLGGCGKTNPLAPEQQTAPPVAHADTDTVCVMHLMTSTPPDTTPGNDSNLPDVGTKSLIVSNVRFGSDSSTVDIPWHLVTVGGIQSKRFLFTVEAWEVGGTAKIAGTFDGGARVIDLGSRNVDTLVVAHFSTGTNLVLGKSYTFYTVWKAPTGQPMAATPFSASSTLCSENGRTWWVYRQWNEECTIIVHQ